MTAAGTDAGGPAPSEAGSAGYYADVPNRIAALVVDAVVLSAAILCVAIVVSVLVGPVVEFDSAADGLDDAVTLDRGVAILDAVLSLLASAAYFAGSWARRSATPGQRLLRMRVVNAADGVALGAGPAARRWLALAAPFGLAALLTTAVPDLDDAIPDLAVAAWYALLLVTIARSPTKRGLHDRLAGSVVTKQGSPVRWERPRADAG